MNKLSYVILFILLLMPITLAGTFTTNITLIKTGENLTLYMEDVSYSINLSDYENLIYNHTISFERLNFTNYTYGDYYLNKYEECNDLKLTIEKTNVEFSVKLDTCEVDKNPKCYEQKVIAENCTSSLSKFDSDLTKSKGDLSICNSNIRSVNQTLVKCNASKNNNLLLGGGAVVLLWVILYYGKKRYYKPKKAPEGQDDIKLEDDFI